MQLNQTPLYIACERNVMRVAMWLLEHGADVNINCKVWPRNSTCPPSSY